MEPVAPSVELYDISKQPHDEQVSYSNFVKKKFSLYKVMFNKYAVGPGETLKPIQFTFDSVVHLKEVLSLHSVNKFLTEFQIQRGEFKKQDEIRHMIKMINLKLHGDKARIFDLELEGFIEFVLQLGAVLYGNIPEPSAFMPKLFERFRVTSLKSTMPLFQGFFEQLP